MRLVGTDYGDALIGEEADDELVGLGGGDILVGAGGRDLLDGGDGQDLLFGGEGDDGDFLTFDVASDVVGHTLARADGDRRTLTLSEADGDVRSASFTLSGWQGELVEGQHYFLV